MEYLKAFGGKGRRVMASVQDGSTRESIAEDCRAAALSFMSGSAAGWDKLDLALWLTGPYARATRHAPHGERVAAGAEQAEEISDRAVDDLITNVRVQLLAFLENVALSPATLELTDDARERRLVHEVLDADGRLAWIPVDVARMRLRDRLRSLFRADYLNAPYAYAELFVCYRCEGVVFDAHAKRSGICGAHRVSGEAPRSDEAMAVNPRAIIGAR